MSKILIVEDDVNINNLLKEALSGNGYTCGQAFSGTEAALWLEKESWALVLLEHPGQVFSKEAIFTYAWQEEYMGETKTLDVHISNIRKKLKSLTEKEYIQTVWGIGYRLQPSK